MKRFLSLLLFIVLALNVSSQSRYFGINGSLISLSTFSGGNDNSGLSYNLYNPGLYLDCQLNRRFWLQPEMRCFRNGPRYYDSEDYLDYRQNLMYLQVPVLLNTYLTYRLFIQAGPYIGYLRRANVRDTDIQTVLHTVILGTIAFGEHNTDDFNRSDAGLVFGIAYGTGDSLDEKFRNKKVTVAVLPVLDYSIPEKEYGFLSGPDPVITKRLKYYENPGLFFTNLILENLWKRNSCFIVKKDKLIPEMSRMEFTPDELFPASGSKLLRVMGWGQILDKSTNSPDYEKLFTLGHNLDADVVMIVRIRGILDKGYLFLEPNLRDSTRTRIHNKQTFYLDVLFLDVGREDVIAYGYYASFHRLSDQAKLGIANYISRSLLWYMPVPDMGDRAKKVSADILSEALGSGIQVTKGLNVSGQFFYTIADETWKMYPEGYFEQNYALTEEEFAMLMEGVE